MTLARTCLMDVCYTVYANNGCDHLQVNIRVVSYRRVLLKKHQKMLTYIFKMYSSTKIQKNVSKALPAKIMTISWMREK